MKLISCTGGGEIAETIDASYYKGPGGRVGKEREIVCVEEDLVANVTPKDEPPVFFPDPTIKIDVDGVAFSVRSRDFKGGQCVVAEESKAICIGNGQVQGAVNAEEEMCKTLNCMHDPMAILAPEVAHTLKAKGSCDFREDSETYICAAVDCRNGTENAKVNGTLQAKEQGQNLNSNNVCRTGSVVRRLTPMECERLQDFPDNWSKYGLMEDGTVRELPDTARYKIQGNSIARPWWRWVLRRIAAQYEHQATLGSLFDGQAGFPLCWKEVGGKTLWVSEIDKYASAVTRYNFRNEEEKE